MKLPRWLMIGLWTSSVLAVLATAGGWWVTWPERTAMKFADLLAAKKWDDAIRIMVPLSEIEFFLVRGGAVDVSASSLRPSQRTGLDLIIARQYFEFVQEDETYLLKAERGTVGIGGSSFRSKEYLRYKRHSHRP